jgi:hypothetical protein
MVNDRLYINKACRDARSAVMDVFSSALSSGKSESDPEIAPLAKQLVAGWEKQRPGHDTELKEANTAIEKCDEALYAIGHLGSF